MIKEVVQEELKNVKKQLENLRKMIQGVACESKEGLQRQ